MLRTIILYGVAAGVVVAVPMFSALALNTDHDSLTSSALFGYLMMVLALSLVFFGVKRYRDREKGGIIKFVPALLLGLGISAVASVVYVAGWELTQALTHNDFIGGYAKARIEEAQASGMSGARLEALVREMEAMKANYANPLFRLPMTFVEIFPVGVIVSLVSAALLRNARFLPARWTRPV